MSDLSKLLKRYITDKRIQQISSQIAQESEVRIHLEGLVGSQNSFVAAATYFNHPMPNLYILENKEEAAYFMNDLKSLFEQKKDVLFFPDSFKKPSDFRETNKTNVLMRTETLSRLVASNTTGELLVTYPEALFEKVVNTRILQKNTIHIAVNERINLQFIIELLVEYGFERSDFVYEPGQFSWRGGIVDIYSFGNDLPYRIELFGEEVESIRIFDPLTQLSVRKVQQINIVPNIQTQFSVTEKTSLLQLLPKNTAIWVSNPKMMYQINQFCYEKATEFAQNYAQESANFPDSESLFLEENALGSFISSEELFSDLQRFNLIELSRENYFPVSQSYHFSATDQPVFHKNFQILIKDLKDKEHDRFDTFLLISNPKQVERLHAIFEDLKADVAYLPLLISVYRGFIDYDLKIACYTDHQIFDRYYKYHIKQGYSKDKALTIKLLRELQPGDYVTHIDHGVGIFAGLERIDVMGKPQEAVRLVYKDNDVLYVSVQSLHKISKYAGNESKVPKIHKLGSDAWENTKRKIKTQIKVLAFDLIKVYAKRKATKGFAFSPDTYLQTEVEASFEYEDTPDQLRITQDIKNDMESLVPMDRLVCGDVGFGKTEIAVRAAAKAVADGKQVAVLVPTTILAEQHYETFQLRLKDFPCQVDYLNRHKSTKERNVTLKGLEEGKIDIVIGTHAIVSKSVKFKDLGLLIVDEEQKFGVGTKETLRHLKSNIDTLTLTATPIPRTLQFSLMSARDLSVMTTPPPNRQPITTEIVMMEDKQLRDIINYEIYRGGQVYYVHNRIKDLYEIANMILRLCPDVSVGVAYGQMKGDELEDHIAKFRSGKYDVLVSTTIVEAGLDIPNANTIIISNAHHFGLSDLHQLRGRVGRGGKKAFCYLICPPVFTLPEDSRRRLKALEELSDLGSGFQIAMKDLDIRGAGNILGAEQSGFIADIGFDMYQKILNEAVRELKQTDFKDVFADQIEKEASFVGDCQIDTDLEMLIPPTYISNTNERLLIYTQLDAIEEESKLRAFAAELQDRFGRLPRQVITLFNAIRLRWVAKRLGFERVSLKSKKMRCYFLENSQSSYFESDIFVNLLQYVQQHPRKVHLKETNKHLILTFENVETIEQAQIYLGEMESYVGMKTQ